MSVAKFTRVNGEEDVVTALIRDDETRPIVLTIPCMDGKSITTLTPQCAVAIVQALNGALGEVTSPPATQTEDGANG